MKCVSCNYDNQEGARFCRSCGAKLEPSATIKQSASLVKCIACGSSNAAVAKFCAKCGKPMTGEVSSTPIESSAAQTPAAPASTQKASPNRKRIYVLAAIAAAMIAIGGGSYFAIQHREEQRLALEKANQEKQRALDAAEQARRQAEEQTAKLVQQKAEAEAKQKELEAEQRETELKQREAEVKRQAADVQRRQADAKRMEQEAGDRQASAAAEARNRDLARAQQDAIRKQAEEQRQRAAAAAQPPARTATRTAKELCADRPNFISRGICEGRECQKPEHQEEALCKQMKESAGR